MADSRFIVGLDLGTLELWCVARDGDRRWKVEFNVRQPG